VTKQQRKPITKGVVILFVVLGAIVLLAAGYFALVRPKRQELAATKKEVAAKQAQIQEVQSKTAAIKNAPKIHVADLYQLTKAMPDTTDIADAMLALNQIADDTGISFVRIAPQPALNLPTYQAVPIQLVFQGNFYDLADFVYRLRNLVRVRHGKLDTSGRLFAVDQIDFGAPPLPAHFPTIRATLQVDAFVYGQATAPAASAATTTGTTDTTETTGTTGTTETTATETAPGASAAGATP
jgi:type II secretory pathway component PulM